MKEIKQMFFNDTLRRWYFEDIIKESKISRERVNYFLKQLLKEDLIKRIKPRDKRPYYLANRDSSKFRNEKKLYGLNLLNKSGLFEHLNDIKKIKTAIIFGSFSRGDWGKSSDIDLFLYGDDNEFNQTEFEKKLKREIQIFKDLKRLDPKVIPNIVKGFYIKQSIEPFKVDINA